MKIQIKPNYILFFFATVIILPFYSCAQNPPSKFPEIEKLLSNKEYLSAFEKLEKDFPKYSDPDADLLKADIAVNYHINTVSHQYFAFKNIKPKEDILDHRKTEGRFEMKYLPIHDILDTLLILFPNRHDLHNRIVEHYYLILTNYPGGWIKKNNDILGKIEFHSQKAIDYKMASGKTYFAAGFLQLQKQQNKQAIELIEKAIALEPDNGFYYYNLCFPYLYQNQHIKALEISQKAYDYSSESDFIQKAKAKYLTGLIYEELSEDQTAYENFLEARKLDMENLQVLYSIIESCLKLKKPQWIDYTKQFFDIAPDNSETYGDLTQVFSQYQRIDDLINFFGSQMIVFKDSPRVLANLHFFIAGNIYTKDKEKAIEHLEISKTYFIKYLPENNAIFRTIDQQIDEFKAK
jgi:tetratricopeptide (TPR) repeat protein